MTRDEIRLMVRRVLSFVVNTLRGITGDTAIMRIKAAILAGAMALATSAASAQGPIVAANNLVNVQVGSIQIIDDVEVRNVLNDLTVSVGVAAAIAANVCGVNIGVLSADLARGADFACETSDQFVEITQ